MNIGFDLDEVFISHPPFIPASLIALLYRGTPKKTLHYRMPGNVEKKLRILSHHPIARPIIKDNLSLIEKLSKQKDYKLHLISSRFSFLKQRTEAFIQQNGFKKIFTSIHFNYENKQPHEFKAKVLKELHLDKYVDDDLPLIEYLSTRYPKTNFYWLNQHSHKKLNNNIFAITSISQML